MGASQESRQKLCNMATNICINSEDLICRNCFSVNDYVTKKNGPHVQATCRLCGTFITFLATDPPRLYFGKYKNQAIADIQNIDYLEWALINIDIRRKRIRKAIEDQVKRLRGRRVEQ